MNTLNAANVFVKGERQVSSRDSMMYLATKAMRTLPPYLSHRLALQILKYDLLPHAISNSDFLSTKLWGMNFSNPVGMSAGFDKGCEAVNGLFGMGFGFVETGTVTPDPQSGNPRPNLFRLEEDRALVNWLGFPSCGLDKFSSRLEKTVGERKGPTGANIGINSETKDPLEDITKCVEKLSPHCDYLVVNISCPNTSGLTEWQTPKGVERMLVAAHEACSSTDRTPPILLKLSPDLDQFDLKPIVYSSIDAGVSGLIISNTTVSRPNTLKNENARRRGGLSGVPLGFMSHEMLNCVYKITGGNLPLVAGGGISSAQDAYDRIRSGASLIQIYTALVFQGPQLVVEIIDGLVRLLNSDGFVSVSDAVGADHR